MPGIRRDVGRSCDRIRRRYRLLVHHPGRAPVSTRDLIATIALSVLAVSAPARAQQRDIIGPAEIVDGDTIVVNHTRIRLFGMDAPEFDQSCTDNDGKAYSCGHLAAVALNELIGDSPVSCTPMDTDRYHRTVAVCKSADGNDLSDDMVRLGFAIDYHRYSHGRYEAAEKEAREGRRGLWAGRFDNPASLRHRPHSR